MPGKNLTRLEAESRAGVVSLVHSYDVDLDLTLSDETFRSRTTIVFDASPGAVTFVDLIADSVEHLILNGEELDTSAFADHRIQLTGLNSRNELSVDATCRYTNTGEGMHRFVDPKDGEAYLYTQFEVPDARRVYACFEQPDLKSAFTFHVTAPKHWVVVSNEGAQVSELEGKKRWDFEPTPAISTYITAIVAGPYHEARSELTSSDGRTIPLGLYCRASLAEHLDADELFDITRRGFAFYESEFGRPYPFTKYDQLFVPEYNAGAMENAGCVTYRDQYIFSSKPTEYMVERRVVTILHELAHMWFGDLVTMKWWNDLWLNESFAEFMCTLAAAEATRWSHAWTTFASVEKAWAYTQDQLPSTHPIVAEINDLEDVEVNFDGITYAKGAAVLRSLVAYVGREEFFSGVKAYFDKHEWGNTTLDDFLSALEAASGRDLKAWSKVWLEESGVTVLCPFVDVDDNGIVTDAAIMQGSFQNTSMRPHRVTIGGYDIVDGALTRTYREELDVTGQRTDLPNLIGKKLNAMLLVNDEDLAYTKIRISQESLATARDYIHTMTDSLTLAVLLGCAWDMTRDAEIGGEQFVTLATRALSAPGMVPSVRNSILGQISSAAERYTAPESRARIIVALADSLLALLKDAAPGSDDQLLYAQRFAQFATSDEQLAELGRIYHGKSDVSGLTLDDALNWKLLNGLVAAGQAGEAEIAAQLEADPSLTGREEAARARASVPSAEAKQAAFDAAMTDQSLSNDALLATMGGLWARAWQHPELVSVFADRYFASLRDIWQERSGHIAQMLICWLYPTELAGLTDVAERTRTWLAENEDAPAALRRLVSEQLDGVERAEKIQQL
ncbi:aminopeptidase N [Bowdeniella nasicola]|uniref:Aminopeptidase N n=1 Tax=Bowdeniella nasicola TaxID=208480 RepID=A0A1Q5Q3T5_9ACTO|nr:aminopeptidase N [Bowdeniella nasicola]OKL54494.1 aminopeptidase N [Bowdeniella nasicola]